MPDYASRPFTLAEAHTAAANRGYKPTTLGNRGRFSFNSHACHVGGDSPSGCWAVERDGWVYFHCHKHGGDKTARLEAQRRITTNLGLPEYRVPGPSNGNGQPYQVREWTYRNALTGEKAAQVVERYDGACWRKDCPERFAHKHPWLRREEKWRGWPTDGFLLLEHVPQASDLSEKTLCAHGGDEISCTSCTSCTTTTVLNENSALRDWAIIAEGETTAEAAAACDYRAFSYQGGSNGAGKADYSPVRGLSVLIAPDNDRPGGGAALTAAIRCLESGAAEVRIMPTDAFHRRGEDLADLELEMRQRAIEDGWFAPARELGPLLVELAMHAFNDRCIAATKRPLVSANTREHLDDHVEQVWAGILQREEVLSQPSLFVSEGKLAYLLNGGKRPLQIVPHIADSIAILAAKCAHWHVGWHDEILAQEPDPGSDLDDWREVAAALGECRTSEHAYLHVEHRPTRKEPDRVCYVLRRPAKNHPQRSVTNALMVNPPHDLPHLDAVLTHPFLNKAGDRLITDEGYHPDESVYLQTSAPFTPVPIQQAIDTLDDIFGEFPFDHPTADRTNLYAAIITKICRWSYDIAPMFIIDKPKHGTGATLLAEMIGLVTTGASVDRVSYSKSDLVEFEKRLASTCRTAGGVILMNNLSGTLDSATLADILTADDEFYKARDLGLTRNLEFNPRSFVLVGTANNLSLTAELANRALPIRLDARMERPDRRLGFRHSDVKGYLKSDLTRFRNAALSIVHHWIEKGRPPASELPMGLRRYPVWQRQTAAILEAAGLEGFATNTQDFEERAITNNEATQHPFIQLWWETHRTNPVSVNRDLAPMALGDPNDEDSEPMLHVEGSNDKARRASLGKMINKWINQTYELDDQTVRLVRGPRYKNRYLTWILQPIDSKAGAFPLLATEASDTPVLVQEVQEVQEIPSPPGGQAFCGSCSAPLLPDENGPDCEGCSSEVKAQ